MNTVFYVFVKSTGKLICSLLVEENAQEACAEMKGEWHYVTRESADSIELREILALEKRMVRNEG